MSFAPVEQDKVAVADKEPRGAYTQVVPTAPKKSNDSINFSESNIIQRCFMQ